jgi:hypothetical protein
MGPIYHPSPLFHLLLSHSQSITPSIYSSGGSRGRARREATASRARGRSSAGGHGWLGVAEELAGRPRPTGRRGGARPEVGGGARREVAAGRARGRSSPRPPGGRGRSNAVEELTGIPRPEECVRGAHREVEAARTRGRSSSQGRGRPDVRKELAGRLRPAGRWGGARREVTAGQSRGRNSPGGRGRPDTVDLVLPERRRRPTRREVIVVLPVVPPSPVGRQRSLPATRIWGERGEKEDPPGCRSLRLPLAVDRRCHHAARRQGDTALHLDHRGPRVDAHGIPASSLLATVRPPSLLRALQLQRDVEPGRQPIATSSSLAS